MCVNHSHFHLIFSLTLAFYLLLILFPLSFVIGSMIRITNSLIYIIIQSSNQMLCYLNICLTQYNFFFILLFVCKLNKKLSRFFLSSSFIRFHLLQLDVLRLRLLDHLIFFIPFCSVVFMLILSILPIDKLYQMIDHILFMANFMTSTNEMEWKSKSKR